MCLRDGAPTGALWVMALSGGVFLGCVELRDLDYGQCGNGLVERERGEQCDTAVDELIGTNLRCGPPSVPLQACQYVCREGSSCPVSWVCGDDGVCYHPDGTFEPVFQGLLGAPAVFASSGDFDGDGGRDIFFQTGADLVVQYGERDLFRERLELPIPHRNDPGIEDINGDGISDVVLDLLGSLVVMQGSSDRALIPVPVPEPANALFELPPTLPVRSPTLLDVGVTVALFGLPEGVCLFVDEEEPCTGRFLVTDTPATRFDAFVTYRSQEVAWLAIAVEGASRLVEVELQGVLSDTGSSTVAVTQTRSVPLAGPLLAGSLQADLDGDGDARDLLLRIEDDHPEYLDRALRVLAGPRGLGTPVLLSELKEAVCVECGTPPPYRVMPLGVGDFDEDGVVDFVFEAFVGFPGNALFGDRYVEAIVGDFNRDGHQDVLAAPRGVPRVDHFIGLGDGTFNPTALPTSAPVSDLVFGDLDGDLLDSDFAFVERSVAGDAIVTMFADPPSFSTRRIRVAGTIESLESIVLDDGDQIADLWVRFPGRTAGASSEIAVLSGTTLRLMLTQLSAGDVLGRLTPAIARFGPDSPVSVFGIWGDAAIEWRVDDTGVFTRYDIRLDDACDVRPKPGCLGPVTQPSEPTRSALLFFETTACGPEARVVAMTFEQPGVPSCRSVPLRGAPAGTPLRGVAGDLDGDGEHDAATLVAGDGADHRLVVAWGFMGSNADVSVFDVGQGVDMALIDADGDPAAEVAVVSADAVTVHDLRNRNIAVLFRRDVDLVTDPVAPRLVADDFTGDSLTDLVLTTELAYVLLEAGSSRRTSP